MGEERNRERETQRAAVTGQVALRSPHEVSAAHVSTISHSSHLGSSLFTGLLVSFRSLPSQAGG